MLDGYHSPPIKTELAAANLELVMFLTAKIHVVAGLVIGALAVMVATQMCKQRKTHKHSTLPANLPQE